MPQHREPTSRLQTSGQVDPSINTRVEAFATHAKLNSVAKGLRTRRGEILRRWLEAARAQPFHAGQPERAVSDHIPNMFDAMLAFLERSAPSSIDPGPPLDDAAVRHAARSHARDRFRQGLTAADVLSEFRLLRQEIGRALREETDARTVADVLGAELLVQDALDGAATLALAALEAHEAEHRRVSAELAAIVDSSLDAIISKTLDGVITSWNPAAQRLYGYTAEEAIGRNVAFLASQDRPDEIPALLERLRRGERVEPYDTVRIRKDGSPIEVSLTVSPMRDSAGNLIGASAIARDISQRKVAEREREAVLAVVAHDLRSPLTAIKGNADLLQRQAAGGAIPSERIAERAASISTSVATMTMQIDELLDAARLRAGESLELVRRPTDLVDIAYRLAADVQETTTRHTIDVRPLESELVGEWDAMRIERVLGNLLGNAIKYSPDGGDISVEIRRAVREGQPCASLAVRDQGVGIPSRDLERIFEHYQRASNVVGRFPGEGIGLAGAKHVIEQHGGAITVESQEGQGSTFTVWLPLTAAGR